MQKAKYGLNYEKWSTCLVFSVYHSNVTTSGLYWRSSPRATTCSWLGWQPNSPALLCVHLPVSLSRLTPLTLSGCQIACQRPSMKYNDKPSNALPHEFQSEMRGCSLSSLEADRCAVEQHTHTKHTDTHEEALPIKTVSNKMEGWWHSLHVENLY